MYIYIYTHICMNTSDAPVQMPGQTETTATNSSVRFGSLQRRFANGQSLSLSLSLSLSIYIYIYDNKYYHTSIILSLLSLLSVL